MAAEWVQVDPLVLELAEEIINEHCPDLLDASIAFLFKTEAPQSNGQIVLGQAKKVGAEWQALGLDHDFFIWLAQDIWYSLDDNQKRALVHHELCHCGFSQKEDEDPKPKMIPHDFEEFNIIIQLYGFWRPNSSRTIEAVQAALPMMDFTEARKARLSALDPAVLNGRG